jgi:hypothetical protein
MIITYICNLSLGIESMEILEISEISVMGNNSDRYRY